MRLTRYLNVSNEWFDREVIEVMENLLVETFHFEATFENKNHKLSDVGCLLTVRNGQKPTNYRCLQLGPVSSTKNGISYEYPAEDGALDMVYLGLIYELRVVRLGKKGDSIPPMRDLTEFTKKVAGIDQKILSRTLFMRCLAGEKGMFYFQIVLPEHDIIKRSTKDLEMDQSIMEFYSANFQSIDGEST